MPEACHFLGKPYLLKLKVEEPPSLRTLELLPQSRATLALGERGKHVYHAMFLRLEGVMGVRV